jgi:murein DD-endopeptidase MepM/ murein hydrolase activator NlpD
VVNSTFNKFGKNLPPVKTGQRFGEESQPNKKLGLFSERRFLIFTKRGPIEIAFKPIHYTSAIISTFVGITSIIYWSAQGIYSAIDVAQKNDIITEASANIPSPIENDSDTVVNVETQSNITLPTLRKFFDDNQKENYKILKSDENENTILNINKISNTQKDKTNILKYSLFDSTKRNQDIPNLSSQKIYNESNINTLPNSNFSDNVVAKVPHPPKLGVKAKSLRFLASLNNELIQMENVFKEINVKVNNPDLFSVNSIINNDQEVDPESDDFFRNLSNRLNLLAVYKEALQNIPLKPPMQHYYVSSSYGPRKHPLTGKYRMHHGIDLAGTWQENVTVSADGTVVFAGYHGSFGKVIRIKHNYGIMTTYGHLAKINVKRGDIVSEGQVIGKMGRTGKVKGAHLHYEISVNGKSQNPAKYIKIGRNLLSRSSLKGYVNKSN